MPMKKAKQSRFHVHDELTAPERSLPVLKGALSSGGQLSNFLGVLDGPDVPPLHLQEEALEAGWTEEQLLEAIAHVGLGVLTCLITRGGNLPLDGSAEEGRLVQAA